MAVNPAEVLGNAPDVEAVPNAEPVKTRSQSMQRLQVGLFGLGAMVLLVGLANIIGDNADENEASVVTDAAPAAPAETIIVPQVRDPLADAGVVPDMPASEDAATTTSTDNAPPPQP
jgi:hypothetical protein